MSTNSPSRPKRRRTTLNESTPHYQHAINGQSPPQQPVIGLFSPCLIDNQQPNEASSRSLQSDNKDGGTSSSEPAETGSEQSKRKRGSDQHQQQSPSSQTQHRHRSSNNADGGGGSGAAGSGGRHAPPSRATTVSLPGIRTQTGLHNTATCTGSVIDIVPGGYQHRPTYRTDLAKRGYLVRNSLGCGSYSKV